MTHATQNPYTKIPEHIIEQLSPLQKKDNYHGLLAILSDYLTIAFAVYLTLGVSYWLYPISLIIIGAVQRSFANIFHESAHNSLAKSKWINYFSGTTLTGHLILHLLIPYKKSHILQHHPHLGHEEKDPDYAFHLQLGVYNENESTTRFFVKNVLLAVIGYRTLSYIIYIYRDRFMFKDKGGTSALFGIGAERLLFVGLWAVLIGLAVYFNLAQELLLFWFVPLFTTGIAIGWLVELAEHYPLPQSEDKPYFLTRNRHGWYLERFLLGRHNDNYHLIHHMRPAIPFYNLRKAHKILLQDPTYRDWDAVWGGIFTKNRDNEETMISYTRKYREWLKAHPSEKGKPYAEHFMKHRFDSDRASHSVTTNTNMQSA